MATSLGSPSEPQPFDFRENTATVIHCQTSTLGGLSGDLNEFVAGVDEVAQEQHHGLVALGVAFGCAGTTPEEYHLLAGFLGRSES